MTSSFFFLGFFLELGADVILAHLHSKGSDFPGESTDIFLASFIKHAQTSYSTAEQPSWIWQLLCHYMVVKNTVESRHKQKQKLPGQ